MARPVFKTGLRSRRGRGGSIPPHSAAGAVNFLWSALDRGRHSYSEGSLQSREAALATRGPLSYEDPIAYGCKLIPKKQEVPQ